MNQTRLKSSTRLQPKLELQIWSPKSPMHHLGSSFDAIRQLDNSRTPVAEPRCPLGGPWPLQKKNKVQQSSLKNWLAPPLLDILPPIFLPLQL